MTQPQPLVGSGIRTAPDQPTTPAPPRPDPYRPPDGPPLPDGPIYTTDGPGRPMPEEPEHGYLLYRAWSRQPVDGRWWIRVWQHVLAFVLGGRCWLAYLGITSRAGIVRAAEHLATKHWRREIHIFEIDPHAVFPTKTEAETYEAQRIVAECPRYNKQWNERSRNPGAVHRTRRILPRHIADWRRQALLLTTRWILLTILLTWWCWDGPGTTGHALATGTGLAAAVQLATRILHLAIRGEQPTSAQRRRIADRLTPR
ncbi:hypothetical protein [Actinoplanes sp. NBRC 101535]|uniref:hypothetical protein n=1 Tax=Actinoplanes sp. NBRC 101535 TaxID=3032196 RepID=UPI0024A343D2|nr:hypothetical protein [Actinoplanes sp. NBRC 101535]GLY08192.1 hypothetical protein Acsp01_85710 [Actinoplanes sp. NBRC 101535]